jgi:hypothetical protein
MKTATKIVAGLVGFIIVCLLAFGMFNNTAGAMTREETIAQTRKETVIKIEVLKAQVEKLQKQLKEAQSKKPTLEIKAPNVATTSPVIFPSHSYIQIVDNETKAWREYINGRGGPTTNSPVVFRLRTGINLEVEKLVYDNNGMGWYKVKREFGLRYPEKIPVTMYVSAKYSRLLGVLSEPPYDPNLKIVVDLSEQKTYIYRGTKMIFESLASTGLNSSPTPKGTFKIFRKEISRTMQGPIQNIGIQDSYDMLGVPFVAFFTQEGAAFHGAYWHNDFGKHHSHGCVNLPIDESEKLYWLTPVGTKVIVQA